MDEKKNVVTDCKWRGDFRFELAVISHVDVDTWPESKKPPLSSSFSCRYRRHNHQAAFGIVGIVSIWALIIIAAYNIVILSMNLRRTEHA